MVYQTYRRALPSLTTHSTQHSALKPCHLTTGNTPLAIIRTYCTSLQCNAVNITVFNKILNEGAGNVLVWLTGMYDI
jgi:hypothetical protein